MQRARTGEEDEEEPKKPDEILEAEPPQKVCAERRLSAVGHYTDFHIYADDTSGQ